MSVALELRELLEYSDHERRKWREWIAADPRRFDTPFQPDGRFPTLGSLFDHIFLVERRHLARLEGGSPPDATGIEPDDWVRLFEYGDLVRADLRAYLSNLVEREPGETLTIVAQSGTQTMTRRWLAAHLLLHEIRHLAQAAYAARRAGHEPPGRHDLFYFVPGA